MTPIKQFWTLLRFQAAGNPAVWIVPFALCTPLIYRPFILGSYTPNLLNLLQIQNLFLVGFFGAWVLAPEMISAGGNARANTTEFLLTRAVDRPVLYRSRAATLYVMAFLMPAAGLLLALQKPDLTVTEYSEPARTACLTHVAGSALTPDPHGNRSPLVSIPRGNLLIEAWHLWLFAVSVLGVQVLITLLYRSRHRTALFYAVVIVAFLLPLALTLTQLRSTLLTQQAGTPSIERLFFAFAAHRAAFGILTGLALVGGNLWCERRFCRAEQVG